MLTRRRVSASLLALPLLAAPAIGRAASAPKTIRIGMAMAGLGGRPYSLGSALSVVHVQGLLETAFADDGTTIDWRFFAGAGPAVNEALADSALDFAWQGDLPEIVARARGLGTQQLIVAGNRFPVFVAVAKNSPINSLADLRGKTVANFQGTNLQLSVDRILATAGLTEKDLQIVNLDQMTATQAVVQHQIDATFLQLGLVPQLRNTLKIIYHAGADHPTLTPQSSLLVTDAFAAAYPDAVDKVIKVAVGAAHWASLEVNRPELYEIYGKTGYPPAFIKAIFDNFNLLTASSPLWDPFERAQLARSAADSYKYGLIRTPVDTSNWINTGPLDRALASLGLQNYWPQYAPDGITKLS
jgi:sulfonate transport system substrate-binding protein